MKSFMNDVSHDISIGGFFIEEEAISHVEYLDLVSSQMGTLYDLILDATLPSTMTTSTTPTNSHVVDDVIGTFHAQPKSA
jgi:hypothetical protein